MSYEMYLNNSARTLELYQEPDTDSTVVHYLEPDELVSYQGYSGDFKLWRFYHPSYDSFENGYSKESVIEPLSVRCFESRQTKKPSIIRDEDGNEVPTENLYYVEVTAYSVSMYDSNENFIKTLNEGDKLATPDIFYMGVSNGHWISFEYYEEDGVWYYAGETRFAPYASATEADEPENYSIDY